MSEIMEYALEEAQNIVSDVFVQDNRGNIDTKNQEIAANFITRGAVSIKDEILNETNVEIQDIHGPQKEMKALAIKLLKECGFRVLAIERGFEGGIVDVLGGRGKELIAVECGPCRISKLIGYLQRENTALWVIKPHNNGYILYEFNRGKNWDKIINLYEKWQKGEVEQARTYIEKAFEESE